MKLKTRFQWRFQRASQTVRTQYRAAQNQDKRANEGEEWKVKIARLKARQDKNSRDLTDRRGRLLLPLRRCIASRLFLMLSALHQGFFFDALGVASRLFLIVLGTLELLYRAGIVLFSYCSPKPGLPRFRKALAAPRRASSNLSSRKRAKLYESRACCHSSILS